VLAEAGERDAELARGERRGWMHGFPLAVKDLSHAAGLPTSMGSPLSPRSPSRTDSLHVGARMRAAGAIVIGKTNTPEFGLGSHTYNTVFGITRNAYAPERSAGGSSGGAAVALALGMLPVADGSDMMGSLRNPAAFNNVIGMRPSRGRVPGDPEQELFFQQLGCEGPMARTVEDTARLLAVQSGFDARVPLSSPAALTLARHAAARRRRQGPAHRLARQHLARPAAGARHPRTRREGARHLPHHRLRGRALHARRAARAQLERVAAAAATAGGRQAGRVPERSEAVRAAQARGAMGNRAEPAPGCGLAVPGVAVPLERVPRVRKLFERFDFVVAPTAQVFPFDAELHWPAEVNGVKSDTYHRWMEIVTPFTLAGLPTLNVRAGFGEGGLPMGLQLAGPIHADLDVLRLGHAYDQACGWALGAVRPLD
jgi:amidase